MKMCTALSIQAKEHYFGRNLDIDVSYGEEVCVMPRRFTFVLREAGALIQHYAMIGMATVVGGKPLFYEATNEQGLSMAGLNFPGNACYMTPEVGWDNIAPFEFIPWILGQCKTVADAKDYLTRLRLVNIAFSAELPLAPLHWIISDKSGSVVVECMRDGMHVYDNPIGVLTNNPPFPYQMENLRKYKHLRNDNALVAKDKALPYETYSQGLGAVGLPGDVSSMSRFVRMAFGRENTLFEGEETAQVGQFFHLLTLVEMIKGCCKTDAGTWDTTAYSACVNTDRGLYYYTAYDNRRITCIDMHKTDLDGRTLSRFPLVKSEDIFYQN